MSEGVQNDKMAIRQKILKYFREGISAFDSYRKLCIRFGDDAMEYSEFEFWYQRFENRNFDLNYDRCLESKARSLADMPIHPFERIVKELDLTDRFMLRKVSKSLEYLIDSFNLIGSFTFKSISVEIDGYSTTLWLDDKCITYTKDYTRQLTKQENFVKQESCIVEDGDRKSKINAETHANFALKDVESVLKNPKLQLNELYVKTSCAKYHEKFETMLKSLNRKIPTKNVDIRTGHEGGEVSILSQLEEGTLENIVLFKKGNLCPKLMKTRFDQLSQLEQCKNAIITVMTNVEYRKDFPIESFFQLRRSTLHFEAHVSVSTVMRFINALLDSTDVQLFILKSEAPFDIEPIKQHLRRRRISAVPGRPNIRRIIIPNSYEFFEIELNEYDIRIERT